MTVLKSLVFSALLFFSTFQVIAQRIEGGGGHALLLCKTGEVYAVGENSYGQVGDPTIDTAWIFSKVPTIDSIAQVSAGAWHSMTLKIDGSVWVWGGNDHGQLVDGTATNRLQPVQVDSIGKVRQISAGWFHSLFLLEDSTVWGGGSNSSGQLGVPPPNYSFFRPNQIPGLSNVLKVDGGYDFTLVLKDNGTVCSFGRNGRGQLGIGNLKDTSAPVKVSGLANIVDIEAGWNNSYAISSTGELWAFGSNRVGQLGTGSPVGNWQYSSIPVQVSLDSVVMVKSEVYSTIALKNDGTVWAWGDNTYGQLGDGTKTDRNIPVKVQGLQNIVEIGMASSVGMAVDNQGQIFTWGGVPFTLANDTVQERLFPGPITPVPCNPVISVAEPKPSAKEHLNLYPNPTSGILSLKLNDHQEVESLQVLTLTGEVLLQHKKSLPMVDLTHLPTGIYLVSFTIGGQPYTRKVVKE